MQYVIRHPIVDLLEAGVRDTRHHGELLVGIGQTHEKGYEIVQTCDAVKLSAHNQRRHGDFFRIDHGQPGAHIDVSSCRHRVV